jgi:hypothetical protein
VSQAAAAFLKAAKHASDAFTAGNYYEEAFKCYQYEKDYGKGWFI